MDNTEIMNKFCNDFGYKAINTKAEFKMLPTLISSNESLIGIIEGFIKNIGRKEINGAGIFAVTNKRAIFYRKSFIGIETKEEIPLNKISSASFRKGLVWSSIFVTSSNNDAVIEQCDKNQAEKFVSILLAAIANDNKPLVVNQESIPQQLEKLFELKQKGVLTDDEFNQQKTKLLNS